MVVSVLKASLTVMTAVAAESVVVCVTVVHQIVAITLVSEGLLVYYNQYLDRENQSQSHKDNQMYRVYRPPSCQLSD